MLFPILLLYIANGELEGLYTYVQDFALQQRI